MFQKKAHSLKFCMVIVYDVINFTLEEFVGGIVVVLFRVPITTHELVAIVVTKCLLPPIPIISLLHIVTISL